MLFAEASQPISHPRLLALVQVLTPECAEKVNEYIHQSKEKSEDWTRNYYACIVPEGVKLYDRERVAFLKTIDLSAKKQGVAYELMSIVISPDERFISVLCRDVFSGPMGFRAFYIAARTVGLATPFYHQQMLEYIDVPAVYQAYGFSYTEKGSLTCCYKQRNVNGNPMLEDRNGNLYEMHYRCVQNYLQWLNNILDSKITPQPSKPTTCCRRARVSL